MLFIIQNNAFFQFSWKQAISWTQSWLEMSAEGLSGLLSRYKTGIHKRRRVVPYNYNVMIYYRSSASCVVLIQLPTTSRGFQQNKRKIHKGKVVLTKEVYCVPSGLRSTNLLYCYGLNLNFLVEGAVDSAVHYV